MRRDDIAETIATTVLDGFEAQHDEFVEITRRARDRFASRDWRGMLDDMTERLGTHGRHVGDVLARLRAEHGPAAGRRATWTAARAAFDRRAASLPDRPIVDTFYNSVARRALGTVGKSVDTEFDAGALAVDARRHDRASVARRYDDGGSTVERVEALLGDLDLGAPIVDRAHDARRVAARIDAYVREILGEAAIDSLDILRAVLYRQTLAYVIGRIRVRNHVLPLVLTLRHDEVGVAVDAVLLTQDELSIVFSFTRSHFHADVGHVLEVLAFLKGIMPLKPVAELLISLGYYKAGKTEMYRSLRDHLETTIDRFEFARGAEGMVMIVFTLPFYGVVFKVIRDRFAYPKTSTRDDVVERYRRVFTQDRAGRLVEAQEFEGLELPRARFRDDLLEGLLEGASDTVRVVDDTVVLDHVYLERKVWPLDLYVREAPREAAREVVVDYGRAIKDLAAVNVFPGDFLLKNFGVTRHRRVVFYDYDEIGRITECRFRAIPPPRNPEDELAAEPWYTVAPDDVFPEEFERFLGLPPDLAACFRETHDDLFAPGFWREVQARLREGEILEVFPYPSRKRLR